MNEGNEEVKRLINLERADATRMALNEAIKRVERLDGNLIYQKAWKVAIRAIKALHNG